MTEHVTLWEVYRICLSIQATLEKQNGRITALEKDATRIKTSVKTAWVIATVGFGLLSAWVRHKWSLP